MNILLFGVSCVGKTTIGKKLAEKMDFDFYDIDEEIKKKHNITIEKFVKTWEHKERDLERSNIVKKLLTKKKDKVIAVSPISYFQSFKKIIKRDDVFALELVDSPQNIFERMIFSDENDVPYSDEEYKQKYKKYYINEITDDLNYYGIIYRSIEHQYDIENRSPDEAVDDIIDEFCIFWLT